MSANNDLMLDVNQAAELKMAFRRNGWNNSQIKILSEGDILVRVLDVLEGRAYIQYGHLIDCDAAPFVPPGWTVEEHKKGGLWKWNPRLRLHLLEKQEDGDMKGAVLRISLANLPTLNANVLDYLLDNPDLIPDEWRGKYICFWGTVYRHPHGYLFIRYLRWDGLRWGWDGYWLEDCFSTVSPAALAS